MNIRHLSVRQLQVFVAAVRSGNLSATARELHLTQPTVSLQIKRLAEVLAADPVVARHLDPARIDVLLDPAGYLGATLALIDRVLAAARALPSPVFSPVA